MLKKGIGILLTLCMLVSVLPVGVGATAATDTSNVLSGWYLRQNIDFESEVSNTDISNLRSWERVSNAYTANQTFVVADDSSGSASNKVVKMTRNSWRGYQSPAFYNLGRTFNNKLYVEMRVYLGSTNNQPALTLYDSAKTEILYIYPTTDGLRGTQYTGSDAGDNKWFSNDVRTDSVSFGWHTMGVMLDLSQGQATFYFDGSKGANISTGLNGNTVAYVGINGGYLGDTGEEYFDDIRVYTPEAPVGVDHDAVPGWYLRQEVNFEEAADGVNISDLKNWERIANAQQTYQNISVANDPSGLTNNKVAKLSRTSYQGYLSPALYKLNKTFNNKLYVELRVYLSSTSSTTNRPALSLYDSSKTEILYMYPWSDGLRGTKYKDSNSENNGEVKWFSDDVQTSNISAGWYTMGFELDLSQETATFYFNGRKGANISAGLNGNTVAYVGINADPWANDNLEYFDDIRIYTPEAPVGVDHDVVPGWYAHEDIDFEDAVALRGQSVHNQLGWTEQNPTGTKVDTVFAADPKNADNTVLKISHNENLNGAYENADYTLNTPLSGKAYVEFRMYFEGTSQGNITLYDQSGNKTLELYRFLSKNEDSWRCYNSSGGLVWIAGLNVSTNTWFRLGFLLDLDNKTFDLYENGVKRNSSSLSLLSDNVAKLSFNRYRYETALMDDVYFDDICVYKQTAPIQFSVLDVVMSDSNGEFVSQPTEGGKITAVKVMKRNSSDSAVVYVAAYESDRLIKADVAALTTNSQAGTQQTLPVNITLPEETTGNLSVKVFVWNNTNDLKPLIEPYEVANRTISLFIAGDSIAQTYNPAGSYPRAGYGQTLSEYLSSGISVDNRGISGCSTNDYLENGAWESILRNGRSGDYVTIQFAHNDQGQNISIDTYKANLKSMAEKARANGLNPIFITSPVRNPKSSLQTLGDYPEAMKTVANEMGTPVIDLNAWSNTNFSALSEGEAGLVYMHINANDTRYFGENCENYPKSEFNKNEATIDDTHFTVYGAHLLSKQIATELEKLEDCGLSAYALPNKTNPENYKVSAE